MMGLAGHVDGLTRLVPAQDGAAAARLARRWPGLPKEQQVVESGTLEVEDTIEEGRAGKYRWTWTDTEVEHIGEVEHVEVWVHAKVYGGLGAAALSLFSPAGTKSELLVEGLNRHTELRWTFTSVAHWGERPNGTWTLKLAAKSDATLHRWLLRVCGVEATLAFSLPSPP